MEDEIGPARTAEIRAAATPSPSDIALASTAILRQLADNLSHTTDDILRVMLDAAEIAQPGYRDHLLVPQGGSAIDVGDPIVGYARIKAACHLALAQLQARGVLVSGDGGPNDYTMVSVSTGSTSGGLKIHSALPRVESGYRLTPGFEGYVPDEIPLLNPATFVTGMDAVVDDRSRRYAVEALASHRVGLWLSAANLLGALSEGAWYAVGERLRSDNASLADALDRDRTASVMEHAADALTARLDRRRRVPMTEIRSHAAYLRDLRNYGVHPAGDHTESLEHAFTELGCTMLLFTTHRYLVRLNDFVVEATT